MTYFTHKWKTYGIMAFFGATLSSFIHSMESPAFQAVVEYGENLPQISCSEVSYVDIPEIIADFLLEFRDSAKETEGKETLIERIREKTDAGEVLKFLMPGFPFKSKNHTSKCISSKADLAEYLGLITLNRITDEIRKIYGPGAEIFICSDGFAHKGDIIESEENISSYHEDLKILLEDFPGIQFEGFKFKEGINSISDLRELVSQEPIIKDEGYGETLKDTACFLKKELNSSFWDEFFAQKVAEEKENLGKSHNPQKMKRIMADKINKKRAEFLKEVSTKIVDRSKQFSSFLEKTFPSYIRLSVHPHKNVGKKLGLNLVKGQKGTPWHNALVLEAGKFRYLDQKSTKKVLIDQKEIQTYDFKGLKLAYLLP